MNKFTTNLYFALIIGCFLPLAASAANPNLKYFGYWGGVAADEEGVATAGHSNLYFTNDANGIEWARSKQMKAALSLAWGIPGSTGHWYDNPQAFFTSTAWNSYVTAIRPHIDNVAVMLLEDEPHFSDWATMANSMNYAATQIKLAFPGLPVYVNFVSPSDPSGPGPMPQNLDWVGFDCYGPWNNCNLRGSSVPEQLSIFKQLIKPGQKIVLIPQAFRCPSCSYGWNINESELLINADNYLNLAQTDLDVVAVMPFYWWTVPAWDYIGLQDLPTLQEKFAQIGRTITGKTVITPDLTPPAVSVTSPANASTVSGNVTLSANATDNIGVASVEFKVDGVSLGIRTTSPYSLSWDSTKVSNGTHNISAVAKDTSGNTSTATISVNVSNVTIAPLTITTASLPSSQVGKNYSATVSATGGAGGYNWTLVSGSLPPGLTLVKSTCLTCQSTVTISGIPSTRGTYTFTLKVTTQGGQSTSKQFSIVINATKGKTNSAALK
jgi:hypothetical protein